LDSIKRIATPLSLVDFVRGLESGQLPERSAVLTFDDGYVDNSEEALPLLRRHSAPATVFVTTGNIDTEQEFWWDRLETLLLVPERLPEHLSLDLPTVRLDIDLAQTRFYGEDQRAGDKGVIAWQAKRDTRMGFFYSVWKALSGLPSPRRWQALDELAAWSGSGADKAARRTMRTEEIRAMAADPLITIGCHSVDHPPLPAHPVPEQIRQILQSRATLESICDAPVTTFAYPHGEHTDETVALLRGAEFECAVTVEQKVASRECDVMKLPRFGVRDVDGEAFLGQVRQWFGLPAEAETIY
jgi:peptidoglycan/xylan/chitin deacetylase (PgdA/CDA1 family)